MKKKFLRGTAVRIAKPFLFITLFVTFLNCTSTAQIYYSAFPNPSNHYQTSAPSGVLCLAPGFANASQVADADTSNYSSVSGLLSLALLCSGNDYSTRASLALPEGMSEVPAGYYAGFRVRLNTVLNLSLLQNNIILRTYLDGQVQETTSGTALLGLSLLSVSSDAVDVGFHTTLPFDEVEFVLNTDIISLGLLFDYQFFYAFASTAVILPVKLTSFAAVAEGKQVRLDWATAAEVNVAKYELERSSDGGTRFTTIAAIAPHGNINSVASYSYSDASVWEGNFLYRVKMIDKDGSAIYSKLAAVQLTSATKWKVYPTLLGKGTTINISLATNGKTKVKLATLQGQIVRSFTTSNYSLGVATNGLAAGMYILQLYNDGQLLATEKITIQ